MAGARKKTVRTAKKTRSARAPLPPRPTSTQRGFQGSSSNGTTETARRLGIHPSTLRRRAQRGAIDAERDARGRYHYAVPSAAAPSRGPIRAGKKAKKKSATRAATRGARAAARKKRKASPQVTPSPRQLPSVPSRPRLSPGKKRPGKKRPSAPPKRLPSKKRPPPPPPPRRKKKKRRPERPKKKRVRLPGPKERLRQLFEETAPVIGFRPPQLEAGPTRTIAVRSLGAINFRLDRGDELIRTLPDGTHVFQLRGPGEGPSAPALPSVEPEPSLEFPMAIERANDMLGDALRDFVLARPDWERLETGRVFHDLKVSYKDTYGEQAWLDLYADIVEDYGLEDYVFDYEALRDS